MDIEWYYAFYKEQRGPVTEAEFNRLIDAGVIGPETLVWKAGMANWEPYEQVLRREETARPTAGDDRSRTDTDFENEAVPSTAEDTGASIDLGETFDSVWACFKVNLGPIIGGSVVAVGIFLVLFVIGQFVPLLGQIAQFVLTGPVIGAWFYYLLCLLRDQHATVGDMFQRLSDRFAPLFLTHAVTALLGLLAFLPGAVVGMIALASHGLFKQPFEEVLTSAMNNLTPMMGVAGLLLLAGLIVQIYLQVCWAFALPLVADRGMNFWTAIVTSYRAARSRFWSMFVLVFLMNIVTSIAGFAMCCVGLIVTVPFYLLLILDAYETVFTRRPE